MRADQGERIQGRLPGRAGQVGGTAQENRLVVEAGLSRYRAGIPWRALPARFGDCRVIHTRHMRWSRSGVGARVFKPLAADAANEDALLDASIIRAQHHAAGAQGGPQRQNASAAPAGA